MFVPCPHCGYLVALIVSQGGPAQRCPRCDQPVQADSTAVNPPVEPLLSEPAPAPVQITADSPLAPTLDVAPPALEEAIVASTGSTGTARARARPSRPRKRNAPSFARAQAPVVPPRTHWRWYAATAIALLLLALQLVLAQRQELAADARSRPFVGALCRVLQCALPPWREPSAFTMVTRNVQPKPGATGVLTVSAHFRNDARWPQPWPTLLLSLSDADGRQVGLRAFTADEYRGKKHADDLLSPGQDTAVQFDVLEPAPRIVAFTFDFR
ncbi:DUF3426 domain-containing protein [Lysobacter cavernae]|uniref:DUF3426 domain-containing protein n=1 Tax=Lysobacter cavernae TaxID=1685901 RepID=A0ABV7RKZ4_9GAMM